MKFKDVADYFSRIENTPSRLEMTRILCELFKKLPEDDIDKVLYLLQGRLGPTYVKLEFGLGEKMVIKAVVKALNVDAKHFIKRYKELGDIGRTVEEFKKDILMIGAKDLSVSEVFQQLTKAAEAGGAGSQDVKLAVISGLIQTLDGLSARYIVRIPTNTLRLGFSDVTILDAFSWMVGGDKSLRPEIEKAYQVRPDLGFIGKTMKKHGIQGLKKVEPEVFTPIMMMRAQRLPTPEEIIKKVGNGVIEPKYDGFRLQVHYKNVQRKKEVKLFSRNLEEVTFMYPDIVQGIIHEVKAQEIIMEGEAIGFDVYSGNFLPFQETVQRKRKYNIKEKSMEIPLKMFAFELLYLDGRNLIAEPLQKRRDLLKKNIKITGDIFKDTLLISPEVKVENLKTLEIEFEDAISRGLEGVMVKKVDGEYQPGARGWNWIKYKRGQSLKIDDTLDCVVMGYDVGKGKRTAFGIGAFLVGVYDEKHDLFKTVAKIGTGLSDSEWVDLRKRCDLLTSKSKPVLYKVDKLMDVDRWVKPSVVVEIQADEITRSPVHTAGRVMKPTKTGRGVEVTVPGYALRFPRLKRFRDDKKSDDSTSLQELASMFTSQKHT